MALDEAGKTAAKAAIATLAGLVKVEAEDSAEIGQLLHAGAHAIYQVPFRGGITRGKADREGEVSVEKTEKERVQGELDTTKSALAELQKKNPDAANVRAELEPKIQAEKEARKRDAKDAEANLNRVLMDHTRAMVRLVMREQGIKKLPANYLVTTELTDKLVRFTKEGRLEVLGADGVPETLAAGTDPYEHLAKRLGEKATPEDKESTTAEGSGTKTKGAPGKTGLSDKGKVAEEIREEVKAKQDRQGNMTGLGDRLRGNRQAVSGRRGLNDRGKDRD